MTYDHQSRHADDVLYTDQDLNQPNIGDDAVTPGAIDRLTNEVAASAEAILTASDLTTVTTRAAQELAGTLGEAVLVELTAALTRIGAAHGWPAPAERHRDWTGLNVQLTALTPADGEITCDINIHTDGIAVYCEQSEVRVACPPELLAILLAVR